MTEGQRKAAQRRGGQRSAQAQRSEERRFNAAEEPLHRLVEEPDEVVETIIETEYGKVEW